MNVEPQDLIDRAAKRVNWAARALGAASDDLHEAGELGAVANGTAQRLRVASAGMAALVARIEQDRKVSEGDRRLKDAL